MPENREPNPPETNNKSFVKWIKSHKKQLVIVGVSIPTLVAVGFSVKNADEINAALTELKNIIKKGMPYSEKWFEKATDSELSIERENVRLAFCSPKNDFKDACSLQNLLLRFDKEMSVRAWGGEVPHAPSIHREHGWYLLNDD